MSGGELEKKSKGCDSTDKETEIETEGKGCSFRPMVVSGLKVGLSEGDFDRVIGTRIRLCRSSLRKWSGGRIDSYDSIGKKHCVAYEDGETEEIHLMKREFVLEPGLSEFPQVKQIEPKLTVHSFSKATMAKAARRWAPRKKPKMEKRQQRREEEIAKALLTRTPAATFKSVELDDRTSAQVIRKRVKVYSFDEENWLIGQIVSYDGHRRHHLVTFEDGNTTEMDLQAQLCMIELRYDEATALLNSSSNECHCF